ncbi:thioesterase superfamily protein [Paracidovorax avenae ATCC 19860]|uniref:Thioesterase superfamily protein n=1 Tax=Paracidovorax avenae (strain ATCC 19860 / DSM 7227 / CCUG 15838 / JCM 20985 / LMG 2117 / NCPPB 1011) TaxID=643561 RepID=F0Q235_PARA1|nr:MULTISPECIES: thioesterase family protein [Comamonadaceae]ADX45307.1 thioesterase superfamily protein [Paracidovorax avenae ATCC 19860]MDA8451904.1 acyl-CoA thioesterase [Acidovorax sp. GBBC 3297]MDA8461350.1 acyl-CoA thioesterase [Acidovorax sp. GBBC 3333]MDA8466383.1 acyl-CoA thioesterase [Acidovorax sp. GBBC 3332]MDA8471419.1 acyl-CoA thioesterase [Acidovorax sp. GBBC 3299]
MNPLLLSASIDVEIPFHDVDTMDVAWHGHYVKYFELARCALLRRFDYDYPQMKASGYLWPVVECHLKYVRPALYGQRVRVEAALAEYENRIKIRYEIRDAASGTTLTKGHTVQLAVDAATRELQFVSPPIVFANLERACAR